MAGRSRRSLALRRYWRLVKTGRRYRRYYSERHFRRAVVRRLKASYVPSKRKVRKAPVRKPHVAAPSLWTPFPLYQREVNRAYDVGAWIPDPGVEFGVREVVTPFRYGGLSVRPARRGVPYRKAPPGKSKRGRLLTPARWSRTPTAGAFLPSRIVMIYFVVERYAHGIEEFEVVGYRVVEPALPWRRLTLKAWWAFIKDDVWEYVHAYVDARNQVERSDWGIVGDAPVLWHFVQE